jgi:hypothetical protein
MSRAKEVFNVSRLVIIIKGSDSAPTRSPRTGEHLNAKMPEPNALSSASAGKTAPTLNWPKTIDAMTWARRVSAVPGDIYFADPKQLTPLPVIGSLGSVTPLLVLCWREAYSVKQFAKQSVIRQQFSVRKLSGLV